ncbi:T9SS C-terminal target domain-containing protein, partial [Bacteroidetes/Chlorobi group bacterium ChocPot_Mid]
NWRLEEKGFGTAYVFDIALHNKDIFAGTYNAGVFVYSTERDNWDHFLPVSSYFSIQDIEILDSNIFLTKYYSGKVLYSNDFGGNWKTIVDSNGIPNSKIYCIAPDKVKGYVFAGNQMGLYLSKDFGNHWELVNEDLKIIPITQIIIDSENLYLTANQFNMYISNDYGKTFKTYNTDNGLPYDSYFTAMELCSNNIIIGTYYSGSSGKPKGIYFSKDNGVSWNTANINSTFNNIRDLVSFDNFVFAGTDSGIIQSSDCGENWFRPNHDLYNFPIYKLLIYDNSIYAATNIGVFKAPLSDFGITEVEKPKIENINYLYCYPPYPVPATNTVRSLIYWDTSPDIENYDIAVYDIFGNKVAGKDKITIDKQNAYSGILSWNCTNVPDGIYLIRLIHGSETKTMKVIVSK